MLLLTFCNISSSNTSFIKSLEIVPFISQGDFWQLCYYFLNTVVLDLYPFVQELFSVMMALNEWWLSAVLGVPGCTSISWSCDCSLGAWQPVYTYDQLLSSCITWLPFTTFPANFQRKSGRKLTGMITSLPVGAPSPSPSALAPTSHAPLHIFPKLHCTPCNLPNPRGISCPVVRWGHLYVNGVFCFFYYFYTPSLIILLKRFFLKKKSAH